MRNRSCVRGAVLAALMVVTLAVGACSPLWVVDGAASFLAGWILRGIVPSQVTCYQNGQQVDCATLPAGYTAQ